MHACNTSHTYLYIAHILVYTSISLQVHIGLGLLMTLRQSILGIVVFFTYMTGCNYFVVTSTMIVCFTAPVFFGLRNTLKFLNNPRTATMPLLDTVLKSGKAEQSQHLLIVSILQLAYAVQGSRDGTNFTISLCNAQRSYSPGWIFLSFFVLTGCMYCQGAEAGTGWYGVLILYQCCKTVMYYAMGTVLIMVGEPPCTFAHCGVHQWILCRLRGLLVQWG